MTIVGHSEGGLIALCLEKTERPEKLILVATAGRSMREILFEQIYASVLRETKDEKISEAFLCHAERAMQAIADKASIPDDLPPGLVPIFNEALRKHWEETLDMDPLLLVKGVCAEILVVNGTHDMQVHHERDAELLDKKAKNSNVKCKLVKIEKASHAFKLADNPLDAEAAFTGPTAPELLKVIRDFMVKPITSKNKPASKFKK